MTIGEVSIVAQKSGDKLLREEREITMKINDKLKINSLDNAIHVVKGNGTEVNYFLFPEYEVHLNRIPKGVVQEWHYHSKLEEVIVVTKGVLTCKWIEQDKEYSKQVHEGEVVQVRKSLHTFENNTSEDVLFIVFRLVLDGKDKRELIKNDKTLSKRVILL